MLTKLYTLCGQIGLDLEEWRVPQGQGLSLFSPVTGERFDSFRQAGAEEIRRVAQRAQAAFDSWRKVPPHERGNVLYFYIDEIDKHQDALAYILSFETGKTFAASLQELGILKENALFALSLSRQLSGSVFASQRPLRKVAEAWLPLSPALVVSPFDSPVATWSWHAFLALICGNSVVWKPSSKALLTALALNTLLRRAAARLVDYVPEALSQLVFCHKEETQLLAARPEFDIICFEGTTKAAAELYPILARRICRFLPSLGSNNTAIIAPSADIDLAVREVYKSAILGNGQHYKSIRRLFVHKDVYEPVLGALKTLYATTKVGSPLEMRTDFGPLSDAKTWGVMQALLRAAENEGGRVYGGKRIKTPEKGVFYVTPAIVEAGGQESFMLSEAKAPVLFVIPYTDFKDAVRLANATRYPLASAVFTNDFREAELFISTEGIAAGVAHINAGPHSGEPGLAIGGEQLSGNGYRKNAHDAWKSYMRCQASIINFSPLSK